MRLALELPEGVAPEERGERGERGSRVVARSGEATLAWGPLVPLPDDRTRWIQRELRAGIAAGSRLELVSDALDRTRTGWPLRVVVTRAIADRGAERWRVHGFYAFFEHAAVVAVEAPTREQAEAVIELLRTGAPRWDAGIAALAQLWDVPAGASPPGPDDAAPESPADTAAGFHVAGLAHARAGRPREAIAAWEAGAALDPLYVDGLYNAGIAHAGLGDMVGALDCWSRGLARAPRDFWLLRKLVQAHNALGRFADAGAARARLLEVWSTSTDPAVQRARAYVFHQETVDGLEVHGSEVLVARDAAPVLYFEPVHVHGHERAAVRVCFEPTPEGGACVVLDRGGERRELERLARRPPFRELVGRARRHLVAALAEGG